MLGNTEAMKSFGWELYIELIEDIKRLCNSSFNDYKVIIDKFNITVGTVDTMKVNTRYQQIGNTFHVTLNMVISPLSEELTYFLRYYIENEMNKKCFDYNAIEYGLNQEETIFIFAVLHEFGHIETNLTELTTYGYLKTDKETKLQYRLNSLQKGIKGQIAYRKIKDEVLADKYATSEMYCNMDIYEIFNENFRVTAY